MLGILIALAISWLLLYLFEKKSLLALGPLPLPRRLAQFGIGFLVTAALCVGVQGLELLFTGAEWVVNRDIGGAQVGGMFVWDLRSVVTEELLFRGALLYILIQRFGTAAGVGLSAIAFGVYHWFSFGIMGAVVPMIVIFIGTGLMGYAWALAFAKTESIAMPIGLHLGWNFTHNTVFSNGPLGDGIILTASDHTLPDWFSLIGLWLVPLIVLLFVQQLVSKARARPAGSREDEAS